MRSWFFDIEPEKIPIIYQSLKVFTEYCYKPENQLILKLENGKKKVKSFKKSKFLGDTVLWANTRLLHARSAYRNSPGRERSLMGCYFMWDIIKSKVRLLRDRLQHPENQNSI